MTTLHILLAVGAFLFLLPGLLIFALTALSANSQIPFQLLNEMLDVPDEHFVEVGWRQTHYGFKIGNVINDEERATRPAMAIAIGFSYRR